jgi:hypothetical protein
MRKDQLMVIGFGCHWSDSVRLLSRATGPWGDTVRCDDQTLRLCTRIQW